MEFLKTLKQKSMKKSIGRAVWPIVLGLLLSLVTPVAGLVCLALAVFLIVYAGSGKYQKQVREKAEELSPNDPEAVLARAARLRESEPVAKGIWVGQDLMYFEHGARQWLYGAQEVCWAYLKTTWHRVFYIIPIWKSHALVLRTTGDMMHEIPMGKGKVLALLEKLPVLLPHCVTGYSKDLQDLFYADRERFLQLPVSHGAELD